MDVVGCVQVRVQVDLILLAYKFAILPDHVSAVPSGRPNTYDALLVFNELAHLVEGIVGETADE
jgi:hypothetical protein